VDDPVGQLSWRLELVPTGHDASDPKPGDFILCHRKGLVSALIRLGERIRPGGDPRWSHAALIETPSTVIEALTRGTVRSALSEYRQIEYAIVRTGLVPEDAAQAVAFARSCVGRRYGWLTIAAIAVRTLTPGHWLDGTEICSGEVAQALCRGWANFASNPASLTPSQLASYATAVSQTPRSERMTSTDPVSHIKITKAGLIALATTVIGQLVAYVPSFAPDKQTLISLTSAAIAFAFLLANGIHALAGSNVSIPDIKDGVVHLVHDELDKVNFSALVKDAVALHSPADVEALVKAEVARILAAGFKAPAAQGAAAVTSPSEAATQTASTGVPGPLQNT
jgi:energy-converting hydrogenase Eha subunit A